MKKIIVLIGILIISWILGGSLFVLGIIRTNTATGTELETVRNKLAEKETEATSLKMENATLKEKAVAVREYATFLSLALCPTLESANKDSLCMSDGAEWFNQTLQAGSAVSNTAIKTTIDAFTQSLGNSKKLSSKQFYELLKPLETDALRAIIMMSEN